MSKEAIIGFVSGAVGVVVGVVLVNYSVNTHNYNMMRTMGMGGMMNMMMEQEKGGGDGPMMGGHGGVSMEDMTQGLMSLQGEEFDKAFIETMIVHHQGAIDMANLIPTRTAKQELRKLGEDIVSAQTKEIGMMNGWLKTWFGR